MRDEVTRSFIVEMVTRITSFLKLNSSFRTGNLENDLLQSCAIDVAGVPQLPLSSAYLLVEILQGKTRSSNGNVFVDQCQYLLDGFVICVFSLLDFSQVASS